MKVLHVITRMNTGGPAVFLDHLTNSMKDLGVESIIAYGYCESNESEYVDSRQLNAKMLKIQSLHRSLSLIDDLKAFFQIREIIKQIKPDIINTHTSKAGVLGRFAAKSLPINTPIVHSFLGHLIYGYFGKIKIVLFTLIERVMSFFTDASVAVTEETKKSLLDLGVGKRKMWEVIRIGLPLNTLILKNFSVDEVIHLLWVGRFTDIKDPGYALSVMQQIGKIHPNKFELTMVGGGELLERTKALASNLPVTFLGWKDQPIASVNNFDLLLLTSKNEGLPLVILEAAQMGRATLSRNVGGVSEFIKDNETGYLINGAASEMANLLINLLTQKQDLKRCGKNAKIFLEKEFNVQKMSNAYLNLYQQLLKKSL